MCRQHIIDNQLIPQKTTMYLKRYRNNIIDSKDWRSVALYPPPPSSLRPPAVHVRRSSITEPTFYSATAPLQAPNEPRPGMRHTLDR